MYRKVQIESTINNLGIVEDTISEMMVEIGISRENYNKILVSTLEGVNNAIIHGNQSIRNKIVEVEIIYKENQVEIKITDEGKGFKPEKIPDPTMPENLESVNGRGVFLMSKLADEVKFSKKGNTVRMMFKNIKT